MVSRAQLRSHGLRAYELGRLKTALRVGLVILPLAGLCLIESRGREACACVAVVLLVLCVWLRWRDRQGYEVVAMGLRAGAFPLLLGLLFDRFGLQCGLAEGASFCTASALIVGGVAGGYVGFKVRSWHGRFMGLLTAAAVAGLAAGLGCVRLGVLGVTSVVAGIAAGIVLSSLFTRRPT